MSKLSDFEKEQRDFYSSHSTEAGGVSFWRNQLRTQPVDKRDTIGGHFMDSLGRYMEDVANTKEHLNKFVDAYVHLAIAEAALDGVDIIWEGTFAENVVKLPQEELIPETTIDMSAM